MLKIEIELKKKLLQTLLCYKYLANIMSDHHHRYHRPHHQLHPPCHSGVKGEE